MQQNRLGTALDNLVDMLFLEHRFSVNDHVVTFDRNHLARILVHEILDPGRKNPGGQLAPDGLLQSGFGHFHFVREIENLEDLLIGFETDGTQQGRNGQLFLTVDVRVHHVVDVGSELDPRSLERDDTS